MNVQWTFSTCDPDTALKLSEFCAGLGYVTESRSDATPVAPRKSPAKRKAIAVDMGGWADPEARKVRSKENAWANALCRKPQRVGGSGAYEYANALGVSIEEAHKRIQRQREYEAIWVRSGGLRARP